MLTQRGQFLLIENIHYTLLLTSMLLRSLPNSSSWENTGPFRHSESLIKTVVNKKLQRLHLRLLACLQLQTMSHLLHS